MHGASTVLSVADTAMGPADKAGINSQIDLSRCMASQVRPTSGALWDKDAVTEVAELP